jgi:hypothetical protein
MSQEFRFEARELLPYTDAEIREIYLRSQAADRPIEDASPEARALAAVRRSSGTVVEAIVLAICAYLLAYVVFTELLPIMFVFVYALLFMALSVAVVLYNYERRPIGPWSWSLYRRRLAAERAKQTAIDTTDPAVLQVVVERLSREPIVQAEALDRAIQSDLERIEASLAELPSLDEKLRKEMASADESLRTLIKSRLNSLRDTMRRLRELREDLIHQRQQAEEAVQPIRDLLRKFERLHGISESLARIQALHGIVEESEERAEDHRLQLRLLWALSSTATSRLKEIQTIVEAHEQAQAELT